MDEYHRLADLTRNSEMELLVLHETREGILSHRLAQAKAVEAELERSVLVLQQEAEALRAEAADARAQGSAAEELRREMQALARDGDLLRRSKTDSLAERERLLQERAVLARENEQLRKELRTRAEPREDPEKGRLLLRTRELEESNKRLSDSLLDIQIKYNKLLLEKTPENPRDDWAPRVALERPAETAVAPEDLPGAGEMPGRDTEPLEKKRRDAPVQNRRRGRPRKTPAEPPEKRRREAPAPPPRTDDEDPFLSAIQGGAKKGAPEAEASKIEKESFFANLTFSNSSPRFNK